MVTLVPMFSGRFHWSCGSFWISCRQVVAFSIQILIIIAIRATNANQPQTNVMHPHQKVHAINIQISPTKHQTRNQTNAHPMQPMFPLTKPNQPHHPNGGKPRNTKNMYQPIRFHRPVRFRSGPKLCNHIILMWTPPHSNKLQALN